MPGYSWRVCSGFCRIFNVDNTQYSLDYLQGSTFLEDLDHIVSCFDKTTKLRFRNSDEPQYVKFGGTRDNDPSYNIRFGQLRLRGSDVAKFFEPSIECIVKAVLDQCKAAHKPISVRRCRFCFFHHILCLELAFKHVVLVGGFAASDWLFSKVQEKLLPHDMNITRPEHHVSVAASFEIHLVLNSLFRNKAVSDGALSFYHDHFVRTRVSKFTFGASCHLVFDPTDPDHQQRAHKTYTAPSGYLRVKDFFDVILPKVCSLFFVIARCSSLFLYRTRKFRRQRNSESPLVMNVRRRTT
jgi:hypothetical protein